MPPESPESQQDTRATVLVFVRSLSFAGRRADHDRNLLLKVFRPGLYLTIFCVTVLTLVHAVLAIGAIYYVESAFLGRLHVGIIFAIALGAAMGVYGMATTVFGAVHDATASVFGNVLTREQHPGIWRFVDDTAQRVGTEPPQHLVAGLDPTFFVTEASVTSLDGEHEGRTLYLSLPLSRILSQAEMASVVGHELGHFKGQDTIYSKKFYPIYRGARNALVGMVQAGSEGARSISLLPAIYALSHFLESFGAAENKLGRERELAADQVGAEAAGIGGHKAMGSALVKIHAFIGQVGRRHESVCGESPSNGFSKPQRPVRGGGARGEQAGGTGRARRAPGATPHGHASIPEHSAEVFENQVGGGLK